MTTKGRMDIADNIKKIKSMISKLLHSQNLLRRIVAIFFYFNKDYINIFPYI
jgi:hypothetical protein